MIKKILDAVTILFTVAVFTIAIAGFICGL